MTKMHKTVIAAVAAIALAAIGVLMTPTQTDARSLTFSKSPVAFQQLLGELESACGLLYYARCSTCPVQGWVMYSGGVVTVHVYEELVPDQVRIGSVTWTTDLGNAITNTVNNHTPE